VTGHDPDRCFAFDQFGPLSIRPVHGSAWAERQRPVRLPATYHQIHGIRCFRGCSVGDDQLWARGRTGGHGVIGAQTGGRGTGTPASAPARDFTGAIGPPRGATVVACNLGGARSTCMMKHVSSQRKRQHRSLAADPGG
jgi:hypothetical protein